MKLTDPIIKAEKLKEKMLSIGTYPEVTRKMCEDARELLKQGIDPSQHRQEQKQQEAIAAENSFESIARLWWNPLEIRQK